jgi:hypothetical protein
MRFLSALTPWALLFLSVFAVNNFQVQLDPKAANSGYWVMVRLFAFTPPLRVVQGSLDGVSSQPRVF